jgi:HNH endonuclease
MSKKRSNIKYITKIRSLLQQEINSICPFCLSHEVGQFQIHHIDENPSNNVIENLILVCPTCHSKITKNDISKKEVQLKKKNLSVTQQLIECANINVDSIKCSWIPYDNVPNAFKDIVSEKSEFPILNFSLINHLNKTILLHTIVLHSERQYSGLSGLPRVSVLKPIAKYKIKIPNNGDETVHKIENEIEIPANKAFKLQIELFEEHSGTIYPIDGKFALKFTFKFSNNLILNIPNVFLNCKTENDKMELWVLS